MTITPILPHLTSQNGSMIYRRETINTLPATTDHSLRYWRAYVRDIFAKSPDVHLVEVVRTGRKTDSQIMRRGFGNAPEGCWVVIASTGGKWGKSRSDYPPFRNTQH